MSLSVEIKSNDAFTIKKDTFSPYIKRLEKKITQPSMKSWMTRHSGRNLKDNVNSSFSRQKYRDGDIETSWEPLKNSTIGKRKRRGTWYGSSRSILKEYGYLLSALTKYTKTNITNKGVSTSLYVRNSKQARIATLHQYGTSKMVARPPLSILKETEEKYVNGFYKNLFGGK